jgi:tetratricopeptide (TPR) repeat protein
MHAVIALIQRALALLLIAGLLCGCPAAIKKPRIAARADRYFKAGEYDKAKIEYLNLLRLDGRNITAYERIGLMWLEEGVPLRAIPFLLRVRELAPNNVAARSKLALAFLAIGQKAEARKEALSTLEKDPLNTDALVLLPDTSLTKEEIAATEQRLNEFPKKSEAIFHLAAASLALHKGRTGAADAEVQEGLSIDPKSAKLHAALAYLYVLRKDLGRAGDEFKRAAELSPPRSGERLKYAQFLIGSGHSAEGKAAVKEITHSVPDYVAAWQLLAQVAFSEKNYDEALLLLDNVVSRDANNPEARLFQSQVYLAKGDAAKATANLDLLDHAYPNNSVVKYQLFRAYLSNKNPAQAAVALQQAIALKPDFAEAILALAELNLRSGKTQAAVAPLEDLLKKRPDLTQARLLLADAYRILGKLDQAALLFREQIKAESDSAQAHLSLGMILRQQKRNNEPREELEKAVELAPNDLRAVDQLLEMDIAEKHYDAALQRTQTLLKENSSAPVIHFLIGKVYAAQQDWGHAESELQRAIQLDGKFLPANDLLIQVYVAQHRLPEVARELEASLATHPDNPRALASLGLVYGQLKDYAKARDAYEKLLSVESDSVPALNNLAYLYAEHFNQLDKAYELAQKARDLEPNNELVADTLGWILYDRKDYQQAATLLHESAAKLPDNPEAQYHLGMAAYMMGQPDVALAALEKAAAAKEDFPGKAEAERRVAYLKNSSQQTGTQQQPGAGDVLALTKLAESHEQKGEVAQAISAYEQLVTLNPKLVQPMVKLAQLYAGPGQNDNKAVEFAKQARQLAPNDPQIAAIAGRIALKVRNFTWAYSLLHESARKNNQDAAVLHDLALTAYALGKVSEAREAMGRSLEAVPDGPQSDEAKRFLTFVALDQPSPEVVATGTKVQETLKEQPNYVPAMMALAAIHLQRKESDAAVDIYSRVLQIYPDFAPAQKWLAIIYAEDPNKLTNAYDLAMKARKTLPDDAELARTLARISFKRKEFRYAVQLLEQSATTQPLGAQDLGYLGLALMQSKQESKGRTALELALKQGLNGPLADEAKKRLAERQPSAR